MKRHRLNVYMRSNTQICVQYVSDTGHRDARPRHRCRLILELRPRDGSGRRRGLKIPGR